MRLIAFLKQITEFEQLNADDQVYLIKLNLIVLSFFHSMFLYDPTTNTYHEQDSTDPFYSAEDWTRTFNEQFHADIQRLRDDFLRLFPSSDIMIKLSFLILIFSNRLSLNEGSQCSTINTHSLGIFRAQNVFTDLLYKYCIDQHGSVAAPVMFTRYVSKLMKLQQLIDGIRVTISDYVDITQFSPLMESLLLWLMKSSITQFLLWVPHFSLAIRSLQKFKTLDFHWLEWRAFRCNSPKHVLHIALRRICFCWKKILDDFCRVCHFHGKYIHQSWNHMKIFSSVCSIVFVVLY